MSAKHPRSYRFATPAHWHRCLLHRFSVDAEGGLTPTLRLGTHAIEILARGPLTIVAVDPYDRPIVRLDDDGAASLLRYDEQTGAFAGPIDIDRTLAASPRWIIARRWLWAFVAGESIARRYDRDTLDHDLTVDVPDGLGILDAAADGGEGLWLLVRGSDDGHSLIHVDCQGRTRERWPLPCGAGQPQQLGSVDRGRHLVVLGAGGTRLTILEASSGAVRRTVWIDDLAPGWFATRLATDGRDRIALWGTTQHRPEQGTGFVLDATGDVIDGPLDDIFVCRTTGTGRASGRAVHHGESGPHGESGRVNDLAVSGDRLWFATSAGLWRLDARESSGARESESTLITPALVSPESDTDRGWLRAEITADLPRGAVIEVQFATTNDPRVAVRLIAAAADESATASARQQRIWQALEPSASRTFVVTGPTRPGLPIMVPLFGASDRWLWLRLHVVTPPGTAPAPIRELRVLYPDLSIDRDLPAVFRGEANDPDGFLRRLVGVLESTTQSIDARIRGIGAHVDPRSAPADWLDYLARWLDLPWDDGLPLGSKRRILQQAGDLIERRGTRQGLQRLLEALLGDGGTARIIDFTVDHPPRRLGGGGQAGVPLPVMLAGTSADVATLGAKAVLGRAHLACGSTDCDPTRVFAPRLGVYVTAARDADRETERRLRELLGHVLVQYIPAGITLFIRWQAGARPTDPILDGDGPGALGTGTQIGRVVLAGRRTGRIDDTGLEIDFRLT